MHTGVAVCNTFVQYYQLLNFAMFAVPNRRYACASGIGCATISHALAAGLQDNLDLCKALAGSKSIRVLLTLAFSEPNGQSWSVSRKSLPSGQEALEAFAFPGLTQSVDPHIKEGSENALSCLCSITQVKKHIE